MRSTKGVQKRSTIGGTSEAIASEPDIAYRALAGHRSSIRDMQAWCVRKGSKDAKGRDVSDYLRFGFAVIGGGTRIGRI